jgi:hypothetical protein
MQKYAAQQLLGCCMHWQAAAARKLHIHNAAANPTVVKLLCLQAAPLRFALMLLLCLLLLTLAVNRITVLHGLHLA